MLKAYYRLTKPGIIYGNVLTAAAGVLLASRGHINFGLLLGALSGIALVIASACVYNNYIDRGIDQKMARTKQRALVQGLISGRAALIYATLLGVGGFSILALYTNALTVTLGVIAFFNYVVLYGIAKRRSVQGTIVGSISGALPLVAGYTAVTNHLDSAALILFFIMVFWQMPHFYAIATYRLKDYAAAGLPVLPVKKGISNTRLQIVLYAAAFVVTTAMLTLFGFTGYTYLIVMTTLGIYWLWLGIKGFTAPDIARWARKMFFFSLIVVLVLSVMLSVGAILP